VREIEAAAVIVVAVATMMAMTDQEDTLFTISTILLIPITQYLSNINSDIHTVTMFIISNTLHTKISTQHLLVHIHVPHCDISHSIMQ
jgi:hypothetical protein